MLFGGQGCPGTGASNAVLGGAGGHRAVGLCAPNRRASGPRSQLHRLARETDLGLSASWQNEIVPQLMRQRTGEACGEDDPLRKRLARKPQLMRVLLWDGQVHFDAVRRDYLLVREVCRLGLSLRHLNYKMLNGVFFL